MVASHRPEIAEEALRCLADWPHRLVSGIGMESCSKLFNACIVECPTETVIICNEKARPRIEHMWRTLELLDEGFGVVGLYRFGFFGFRKEFVRRVGFFDERFRGGWYEDNDMMLRMHEADIAYHMSEEVPYAQMASSWKHEEATSHFHAKWRHVGDAFERLLPEFAGHYDLGPSRECRFLPWSQSVLVNVPLQLTKTVVSGAQKGP